MGLRRGGCSVTRRLPEPPACSRGLPPRWKWQLKKGPRWPREKEPPQVSVNLSDSEPSWLIVSGLSGRIAWDRARSRRQGLSPAKRGRSEATRLDGGEHTVMLVGPTARVGIIDGLRSCRMPTPGVESTTGAVVVGGDP